MPEYEPTPGATQPMTLLEVDKLSIAYRTRTATAAAVDGASFCLEKGKSVGIVGESGCGKTTIGMGLMRLLPPNAVVQGGRIGFSGMNLLALPDDRMQTVRWKRISMIFQAAMNALNPVHKVGDQIIEAIRTHYPEISRSDAAARVEQLYEMVDIPRSRAFDYPHQYSGGMKQRAIIAMALSCNPDLIIADEPTTALDVIVQDQIIRKIKQIQHEQNIAVIFISHDIGVVAEVCHDIMVMYRGRIVESGRREEVFRTPAHPYTQALLASYLTIDGVVDVDFTQTPPCEYPGEISPEICGYIENCPRATDACRTRKPQWRELSATHKVYCSLCE
ncbi:MAG: ABC transporter ATP-binding protein [Desulfobacterales bacterium]|nr:ABC transporter ATP-binding protein [Desulfobacterales bacterium]